MPFVEYRAKFFNFFFKFEEKNSILIYFSLKVALEQANGPARESENKPKVVGGRKIIQIIQESVLVLYCLNSLPIVFLILFQGWRRYRLIATKNLATAPRIARTGARIARRVLILVAEIANKRRGRKGIQCGTSWRVAWQVTVENWGSAHQFHAGGLWIHVLDIVVQVAYTDSD